MDADPLQIVASTADAAFAVDEECRIVIWNQGAEELLGLEACEVLGRPCHEVLGGRDVFGNCFCDSCCPIQRMTRRQEPIRGFEVDFKKDRGEMQRVAVSIMAVPGPRSSQYTLIHLLHPCREDAQRQWQHDFPASPVPCEAASARPSPVLYSLTPRETEVLEVLARGWSTQRIADSLYISAVTVRNHVQSILRKLDVHSKVEAVALALRERLI